MAPNYPHSHVAVYPVDWRSRGESRTVSDSHLSLFVSTERFTRVGPSAGRFPRGSHACTRAQRARGTPCVSRFRSSISPISSRPPGCDLNTALSRCVSYPSPWPPARTKRANSTREIYDRFFHALRYIFADRQMAVLRPCKFIKPTKAPISFRDSNFRSRSCVTKVYNAFRTVWNGVSPCAKRKEYFSIREKD